MKRILIAWELGSNYGHLAQLRVLGAELISMGHEVTFAIRDLTHVHRMLGGQGYRVVSAPMPPVRLPPSGSGLAPNSYSEILALQGMSDPDCLSAVVSAWQDLFALGRFDAVIAESAPFAVLAASLADFPHVVIGTGFTLPPTDGPFPAFRPESPKRCAQRMQTEAALLSALNQVAGANGKPGYERSSQILSSASSYLVTWPELDHYGRARVAGFVGPLPTMSAWSGDAVVDWPDGDCRMLAYLQPDYAAIDAILQALSVPDLASVVFIPQGEALRRKYESSRMKVLTERASFQALLPTSDAVVFHGSHNVAAEASSCGKPLLMLPQQIEQAMMARRLVAAACGIALSPAQHGDVSAAILALRNGACRNAARHFAGVWSNYDARATAAKICQHVATL